MSDKNAEFLKLAQDAFTASDTYFDVAIRPQIEKDIRQFQGYHPNGSKYHSDHYKGRSKIFRPKTRSAIRSSEAQAAAAFFATDDVVNIKPFDDNNQMQAASADLNRELLQFRLTRTIPWFKVLMGAYQEAQVVGVVASMQHWVYDEKRKLDRPWIDLIPPENIRIDPGASWLEPIESSPYLIVQLPIHIGEIKRKMQGSDPVSGSAKWHPLDEGALKSAVKTGDTIRMQRENGRVDSKDQANVTDFTIAWVHLNFIRQNGDDYVFYTLGTQHLLTDPKPIKEVYWHGKRPVVVGNVVLEAHKTYAPSKPALTAEIQSEINEIANQRIDNVKFAMNKRYFVQRGKQVDVRSLVRNTPSSVTLMSDVANDVKIVETSDVTSSSYAEQDRLNLDFDDMAGAFSGSSVQSNRRLNETVGGMNLLSAGSNALTEYELRCFTETWVEPVLRQIMTLEQHYETDEAVLALCGKKALLNRRYGLTEVTEGLLMQDLVLNVNVGVGSTNQTNQLEKFIYALKSLREVVGDQVFSRIKSDQVVKEIFGKVGYKDGSRFFMQEGDNPEMDMLIEQINQLQSALAAKHPPELLNAQIAEINERIKSLRAKSVKDGVEAVYSAMQTGAVIAQNPLVAPVGDKVMQASGYQSQGGQDPDIPTATTQGAVGINAPMLDGNNNTSPMLPPVPPSPMQGIETAETGMAQ